MITLKEIILAALVGALILCALLAVIPARETKADHTVEVWASNHAGAGTGIVCQRGGSTYIWTAAHVAKTSPDGRFEVFKVSKADGVESVIKADAELIACGDPLKDDVAVLKVTRGELRGDFHFADNDPGIGDKVTCCGVLKLRENPVTTWGKVVQINREFPPRVFDVASVGAADGRSGAGIYNGAGKCVGLLIGGVDSEPLGRYIPVRQIRTWAIRNGVSYAF
jgi:Trypsin-like peptidase domain